MARYSGSGWHRQSIRHINARKYGRAGGKYKTLFRKIPTYKRKGKFAYEVGIDEIYKGEVIAQPEHTVVWGKEEAQKVKNKFLKKYKKHFGGYTPNNIIKGGLADGVNPNNLNQEELQKGVSVELEHTNNPTLAREIATDHLVENPKYYDKLEKIESKPKPINVKIPKHQVVRDKNQLEKDLQSQIKKTIDVINPLLNEDESFLLFMNKIDLTPWVLDLR